MLVRQAASELRRCGRSLLVTSGQFWGRRVHSCRLTDRCDQVASEMTQLVSDVARQSRGFRRDLVQFCTHPSHVRVKDGGRGGGGFRHRKRSSQEVEQRLFQLSLNDPFDSLPALQRERERMQIWFPKKRKTIEARVFAKNGFLALFSFCLLQLSCPRFRQTEPFKKFFFRYRHFFQFEPGACHPCDILKDACIGFFSSVGKRILQKHKHESLSG